MNRNKNIESEFADLREAAIGPSPKPFQAKDQAKEIANTYRRGREKIKEMTGRTVQVPLFDNGVMAYPPAERMLKGQHE